MDDEPRPQNESVRRRRIAVAVAVVPLLLILVLAFLWFGVPPNVADEPQRLVRDASGKLVPAGDGKESSPSLFEGHGAALEANNSASTATSSSTSGNAAFACRRVLILNLSDHLLLKRIGAELPQHLQEVPCVEQVEYFPAGKTPEPGRRAPDVVITLDVHRLDESGMVGRKLDAEILVTAANSFAHGSYYSRGGSSPPVVDFSLNSTVHHRSTMTGVESSAAKYKLAAENIAGQIAETLKKHFTEFEQKYGTLPDLPEAAYPAYREPPKFPALESHGARQLVSWHGLMLPNETVWTLASREEARTVAEDLKQQFEAEGWKTEHFSGENEPQLHLRLTRRDDEGRFVLHVVPQKRPLMASEMAADAETLLYVRFAEQMTDKDVRELTETILESTPSERVLLLFDGLWQSDQFQRIVERLKERPTGSPELLTLLAKYQQSLGEEDAARESVRKAAVLLRTIPEPEGLRSRLKSVAKALGDEELIETADPELLRELGFIEIGPGIETPERIVALDDPVHFFSAGDEGKIATMTVVVRREGGTAGGTPQYSLHYIITEQGSRSWSRSSFFQRSGVTFDRGAVQAQITIEQLPEEERFRVTAKLPEEPAEQGTPDE